MTAAEEPWRDPELRGTWEITEITDASAFMRFVFASAPSGSQWIVVMASDRATFNCLAQVGTVVEKTRWLGILPKRRYVVIALTPGIQRDLDAFLASIDIGTALIEQHIYHDEDLVMCSYDNLSCCWLSKTISYEALRDASRTQGFRFTEHQAV